ncbi:MAG: hypothetical protein WA775_03040 [Psychroserpens sp.]|uniref:hypothetical protein n=1 Tax=Psychroserpens sp. TaxID=2020870 RepID=UPI003C9FB03C
MKNFLTMMMLMITLTSVLIPQNTEAMNKKDLKELHEKHGDIYDLPVGDKIAYLRSPNMADFKRSFTAMQKGGDVAFGEAMLDALFVGGDTEIKAIDDYFNPARRALVDFFNYDDPVVNTLENGDAQIVISNASCTIRKITREDLRLAEKKNPSGKPFVTQEKLFDLVCTKKDDAFNDRMNPTYRFPLYQAMEDLQYQKVATLKKRSPMPS